ncbi:low molecular weight protein arginine phosphatase [Cytobacillus suaedae]|nr:low molecular weight protein arginine phosphatase [Cytobacillus suaedae]
MINILFVCTGNTCRSPMAEAILKRKQIPEITVKSAGVFADNTSEASINTQKVLNEEGIPSVHQSSMLTREQIDWATYIFTMTTQHKMLIAERFPDAIEKTFSLKEFVEDVQADVVDPFGGPMNIYRQTYEELNQLIEKLIRKLNTNS